MVSESLGGPHSPLEGSTESLQVSTQFGCSRGNFAVQQRGVAVDSEKSRNGRASSAWSRGRAE